MFKLYWKIYGFVGDGRYCFQCCDPSDASCCDCLKQVYFDYSDASCCDCLTQVTLIIPTQVTLIIPKLVALIMLKLVTLVI